MENFFEEIFIKKEDQYYTLVIPCSFSIKSAHISHIFKADVQEKLNSFLSYTLEWFKGYIGPIIAIKKIEVIFPPFMEYFEPVALTEYFKGKGVELVITIGVRIPISNHQLKVDENREVLRQHILLLQRTKPDNN